MDKWIPNNSALSDTTQGPLTQGDINLRLSDVWQNNCWNFEDLSLDIPPNIRHHIQISFSLNNRIQKDSPLWTLNGNSLFSYKSAYLYLSQKAKIDLNLNTTDWNWLWNLNTPNKIKYFLWLLLLDGLPVNGNLAKIGLNINVVY